MLKAIQRLFVFFCAMILLVSGPMESAMAAEMISELPWDFSGGMPLNKKNFVGNNSYFDPSILVQVQQKRIEKSNGLSCDYWVATIQIAHPSQLRTTAANGFQSNQVIKGRVLANRVNAVLAINGDYFWYTGHGYILRQGQVFLNDLRGDRDVLLIDEDGDFHVVRHPMTGQVSDTVDGKRVMQALYFGPVLVQSGKLIRDMDLRYDMRAEERRQRMCIAQVDRLKYMCICSAGPARNNSGMTLQEFAQLVYEIGVLSDLNITAYNMDGGDSTMLIFNGERINDPNDQRDREIADIIYFASAYAAE